MLLSGVYLEVKNVLEALQFEIAYETPKELLLNCPFCDDQRANLSVNRDTGLYHCWRCGSDNRRARGDLINLVASAKGVSRVDATEYILQYGSKATSKQLLRSLRRAFRKKRPITHWMDVQEEVDRYYAPRHPYWRERGLSVRTTEKFHLGFDHKRNHAIIPIYHQGHPVAITRRNLNELGSRYKDAEGFQKDKVVFGLDQCRPNRLDGHGGGLYLCEGPIDAMKVHEAGYNGIAVLGDTFSDTQARLIMDYGPKQVVLMTDEDFAGEILARKVWETYPMRNVYYVELPEGRKDPGECTVDEIWEAITLKRHVLGLYLENLKANHGPSTA